MKRMLAINKNLLQLDQFLVNVLIYVNAFQCYVAVVTETGKH